MRRLTLIGALALGLLLSAPAVAQELHDEYLFGCGRGFDPLTGEGNALIYAWAEGIDWVPPWPVRPAWVSWWNPRTSEQVLTLTVSDQAGVQTVRTIRMPARARGANSLRDLFEWTGRKDFALYAVCESTCIASLITWDSAYSFPSEVQGVVGCRTKDWANPYSGVVVPWFLDRRDER